MTHHTSDHSTYHTTSHRVCLVSNPATRVLGIILLTKERSTGTYKPRPHRRRKLAIWHYRWIGRFKARTAAGLGLKLGRMRGNRRAIIYKCAKRARSLRLKVFAIRRGGDCYGSKRIHTYGRFGRVRGLFRAGTGGLRAVDAYVIGKGMKPSQLATTWCNSTKCPDPNPTWLIEV